MKLKLDRPTLDCFSRLTQYGLKQEFENELFHWFYRSTLQQLIIKIARAITRIRKALTLQLTPSEAICLFWTLEFWNEALPNSYEYTVCSPLFLTLKTA